MIIITDSRCTEYHQPGHPERPQRIARTVERLQQQSKVKLTWEQPREVDEAQLRRAHTSNHLTRLDLGQDFDLDTPSHTGIRDHARRSVGGALRAMENALNGQQAFSLLRPPGHHATPNRAMGFCYLNSVAIAALEYLSRNLGKIAVFDFDVHHGNGTEEILLGKKDCVYFSTHQYPAYPGTGTRHRENAFNYPVPPDAPRKDYRTAIGQAIEELKRFKPAIIAVSAGFDAYRGDPLSQASLEEEDFRWLGVLLRDVGVPLFSVLEGGYSNELPGLILAYLAGLTGSD